ncbi:hypothetical protein D920_02284 [Enterococcus faecalis 13-SD-W-01]|nr:hypothetical protein D920_02284 [Enterococcus faecalis 13-SD-W-01]
MMKETFFYRKGVVTLKKHGSFLVIFMIAILFVLPHIFTQNLIIGADSIFHYNRFYETAEQIKHGNFNYFLSLYGFQQSGRIVNAVYGPIFAYLQGFVVLIAGSWFHYQILSNFLLYLISGASMLGLLRYAGVRDRISLPISIIFMGTYSIQYWVINQGFTSWGTSILPLCLIPIVDMVMKKRYPVIKTAISVAVMTQIHLLSTVMLVLIYLPFYLYLFFTETEKGQLLKQTALSILLDLALSANIWAGLWVAYSGNDIQKPFVNLEMSEKAIDLNGSYWLIYPGILPLVILSGILIFIYFWKHWTPFVRLLFGTSIFFLILSTSLIPWTYLVKHDVPFVRLIQFPFRFFVPFTVLFLFFFAFAAERINARKWLCAGLFLFSLVSIVQTVGTLSYHLDQWDSKKFVSKHTYLFESADDTRATFHQKDLSAMLTALQKATPDYLPIYEQNKKNKYYRYTEEVLDHEKEFNKTVDHGNLTITWNGEEEKEIHVPVIKYTRTELYDGNKKLEDVAVTDIGNPIIQQKIGKNQLTLDFHTPSYFYILLALTFFTWFGLFIYLLYRLFF